MIRGEKEYREALDRLKQDEEVLALQGEKLAEMGLSKVETGRALEPMLSFRTQLEEEVEWFERVRRRWSPSSPSGRGKASRPGPRRT